MPSKHTVAVVLDTELLRRIKATAERETISASAVVRRVLRAHFFARDVSVSNEYGNNQTPSLETSRLQSSANDVAPNDDAQKSHEALMEARK